MLSLAATLTCVPRGEFEEIVCRICHEKIPEGHPFERTLDTWLGLVFIPSLRNAGKGLGLAAAPEAGGPPPEAKAAVANRRKSMMPGAPGAPAALDAAPPPRPRRNSLMG